MIRILLAGLAIGVVIQVVTTVSWLALPYHGESLQNFPHERAEAVAFLERFPEPGVYHFPGIGEDMEASMELAEEGPTVTKIVVHPEGVEPFAPKTFATSIAANLLAGIFGAFIFALCRPRLTTLLHRTGFGLVLGTFVSLTAVAPESVWWAYPPSFSLLTAIDLIACWTLAGVIAGFLIRGPKGTAHA